MSAPAIRPPEHAEPARAELLSDALLARIREDVVFWTLAPGTQVSESELEIRYGASRAPLRAALGKLHQEGWLAALPRKGHVVLPITLQLINEVFDLREKLEPWAIRLAAERVSLDLLQRLDETYGSEHDPSSAEGERRMLAANKAFHMAIIEASGNAMLAGWMDNLHDHAIRILYLAVHVSGKADIWHHGHAEMMRALRMRDGDLAASIALEQLRASRASVTQTILSAQSLQDLDLPKALKLGPRP